MISHDPTLAQVLKDEDSCPVETYVWRFCRLAGTEFEQQSLEFEARAANCLPHTPASIATRGQYLHNRKRCHISCRARRWEKKTYIAVLASSDELHSERLEGASVAVMFLAAISIECVVADDLLR